MRPGLLAALAATVLATNLAVLALPAAAHAAVTIQPPVDVVEERAANVAITGTAVASGRGIWAKRFPGHIACPSSYTSVPGTALTFDTLNVPAGQPWAKTTRFEVPEPGPYTVCAWVGADISFADPGETGQLHTTVRRGAATLSFDLPTDPIAETTQKLTVRGSSELVRYLDVAVVAGDVPCAAAPPADGLAITQQNVSGDFATTVDLRRNTPGVATVCGWVKDSNDDQANGAARATLTFRAPKATAAVSGPGTFTNLPTNRGAFAVSGSSETSRRLWVIVAPGDGCAPTVRQQGGSYLVAGEWVAGGFSKTVMSTGGVGRHTMCVFVGTEEGTDAAARAGYTITLDPSLDELAGAERPQTVPPAALTGPVDGLRGKAAKPTFAWAQESWHGDDTLVLAARDPKGKLTRLVDVGEVDAVVHHGKKRVKAKSKAIAKLTYDGARRTVRLKQALPAGDYVWWVERQELSVDDDVASLPSARRTLTVEGAKLQGRLQVRRRSGRQPFWQAPGATMVTARTAPEARVHFTVRFGGRSRTFVEIADRDGYAVQRVFWSCEDPGARYVITVRAADQYGAARTKRVTARGPSRARCRTLERTDLRGYLERDRQKTAKKIRARCTARGGVVSEIAEIGNVYVACLNPGGGTLAIR